MTNGDVVNEDRDMGLFSRLLNIFITPSATFRSIRQRPGWLIPALIYIVLNVGLVALLKPVIVEEQMAKTEEKLMEKGDMSDEQIEKTIQQSMKFVNVSIYAGAVLGGLLMFVIAGAIWLFVSNVILGGEVKYPQMLSMVVYQSFIPLLGSIIKSPLILAKKTINIHFSIATFLPASSSDTFIYKLLSKVEIFNIWGIVVLCIGIAIIGRFNIKKVWPIVVGLYTAWYIITSLISGFVGG